MSKEVDIDPISQDWLYFSEGSETDFLYYFAEYSHACAVTGCALPANWNFDSTGYNVLAISSCITISGDKLTISVLPEHRYDFLNVLNMIVARR